MNKVNLALLIAALALGVALVPLALGGGELGVTNFDSMVLSDSSSTQAVLDVNQAGSGKMATFKDGGTERLGLADGGALTWTGSAGATLVNFLTGNLKIGNGTPGGAQNGEDLYVEGAVEVDGTTTFDGAVVVNGGLTGAVANDLDGGLLTLDADADTTIRALVDDIVVMAIGTATGTLGVTTGSFRVGNGANGTTLNGEDAYIEGTLEVDGATKLDGGATITTLTGANAETLDNATNGFWNLAGAGLAQTADTQNGIGFESVDSAAVITTTNGTLWTVPGSQTWIVKRVFCNVTTNFECVGDDCALIIGDGNDTDGFLVLADAELQAADTEGTGFAAGWQGLVAATIGAYLDPSQSFIYAATDTIDIDIRDVSAGTDPTAGVATCYLDYMRIQ